MIAVTVAATTALAILLVPTRIAPEQFDPFAGVCVGPRNTASSTGSVTVASTFPAGDTIVFYKNELAVTFNQSVGLHSIEVSDATGCKVSRDSVVDGEKVVIKLKACDRRGFPTGKMLVHWTVNGESGKYELHIRHHH